MIQLLGSFRDGSLEAVEIPCPAVGGGVLVAARSSAISAGTERMLVDFGKANWIEKARQQPDKVRMVIDKVRTDGLLATADSVRAKLDQPVALGYSCAGVVLDVGPGITEFKPGDRVVSNAPHAEAATVYRRLCAKIPDSVTDEAASFTVIGAIALQGIRLAAPTLGEAVVVSGLGLIGLITVQLLRSMGCRVLGIDLDPRKLALARSFGADTVDLRAGEDPLAAAREFSRGKGVDAVLVTAATKSSEPIHQAALMSRARGRIVLIGVTGLELSRDDFYKKELSFQVSCSYGPGRYDPAYEEGGHDYPHAHVRWTAQRNFEAILDMLSDGRLLTEPLITHRFPFERALDAYRLFESNEFYLGVVLQYAAEGERPNILRNRISMAAALSAGPSRASAGFIGAGSYASKVLIPAFQKAGARLVAVASSNGLSAATAGRKFGFEEATSDVAAVLSNPEIDTVVIATRHDSHAALVCRALKAGKHVFVEKPLGLTADQLSEIEETAACLPEQRLVMVGFNRRFAPHVTRIRELLATVKQPRSFIYTVNAGAVPEGHWTLDPASGGGRILGEACHFIDLLRFLADSPVKSVQTVRQSSDTIIISLAYEDGSAGAIHYLANGHRSFPKERLEVFTGGRVLVLDNFRKLRAYGWPGFARMNLYRQDKGATQMAEAFVTAIRNGSGSPIRLHELLEVSRTTLQAASYQGR